MFARDRDQRRPDRPTTNLVTQSIRRVTTAPARQIRLTQQTVSCYELPWESLKAWLERRFPQDRYPNLEFTERKIHDDHYIFMTPEPLNSDDEKEIMNLRDKKSMAKNQLERAQSQEP